MKRVRKFLKSFVLVCAAVSGPINIFNSIAQHHQATTQPSKNHSNEFKGFEGNLMGRSKFEGVKGEMLGSRKISTYQGSVG